MSRFRKILILITKLCVQKPCHAMNAAKNIGIEISPNKIITKHMMSEGSGAWLVGKNGY